jgi:hypothetical protein
MYHDGLAGSNAVLVPVNLVLLLSIVHSGCGPAPAASTSHLEKAVVPLSLDPEVLTHPEPVLAGEAITAHFKLVNSSEQQVVLLGARAGCGCTAVRVNGKRLAAQSRLEIPPGVCDVEVTVDTQLQGGASTFGFELGYQNPQSGQQRVLEGRLNATICRGIIAMPPRIEVLREHLYESIRIDLLDDFPGDYSIDRIEMSHPGLVTAEIESVPKGHENVTGVDEAFIGHFRIRSRLVVKLAAKEELPTRQWIRLSSNYGDLAPLEIAIKLVEPTP